MPSESAKAVLVFCVVSCVAFFSAFLRLFVSLTALHVVCRFNAIKPCLAAHLCNKCGKVHLWMNPGKTLQKKCPRGRSYASEVRTPRRTEQVGVSTPTRGHAEGGCSRESPEFGGGVDYHDLDPPRRERLPEGTRESPPRPRQHNTPPEDQNPRGCSLHSLEPLRDWFCKGADMTSASEFEASLCQLEEDPPDIRDYNVNIREERWTHISFRRS